MLRIQRLLQIGEGKEYSYSDPVGIEVLKTTGAFQLRLRVNGVFTWVPHGTLYEFVQTLTQ